MNTGLKLRMHEKIKETLLEDITYKDIGVEGIFSEDSQASADLLAKEDGVICGLEVFLESFKILDKKAKADFSVNDGDSIKKGDKIGTVYCNAQAMLSAERTGLNFLQRMSGIATMTRKMVELLEGTKINLTHKRKTASGLRVFDKYSVFVGGGKNHRYNLSDMAMLKDNHISAAGGIIKAVYSVRKNSSFTTKIEVEAETIEQVYEALESGCDIIMLDNMSFEEIKKSTKIIDKKAIVEVSGNISMENLKEYRDLDIDIISCGALTHSVKALDISLKNMKML